MNNYVVCENGRLVGIDVGINHLLATSEESGVESAQLIGSDVKQKIERIKRKEQGSKKQRRAKRGLSHTIHQHVKDFSTHNRNMRLVVVENLQNLKKGKKNRSKDFRKTLNNWNYRELLEIIQGHRELNRVSFRRVFPDKTSQTCPSCSHVERGHRVGEVFCCLKCGLSNQVDIVGAQNILIRFTSGRYSATFKT